MYNYLFGNDGSVTLEEFTRAFEAIITQILRFEKKLLDKNTDASDELKRLLKEFRAEQSALTKEDLAKIKDQIAVSLGKALDIINARVTSLKQPKDGLDGLDGKDGKDGARGLDGKDGKNGKDGSTDTGEQTIGKINKDKSEKKIKKEKVEGLAQLEAWVSKNHEHLSKLWLRSGGLVGEIVAGTNITVDSTDPGRPIVSATGASFAIITVTGTIDDTNTTFTAASAPSIVVINGASYRHGKGVTISGVNITTDFPVGVGGDIFCL